MVLIEALARPRKRSVLTLENERNFFCMIFHYNDDNNYLFINGKRFSH